MSLFPTTLCGRSLREIVKITVLRVCVSREPSMYGTTVTTVLVYTLGPSQSTAVPLAPNVLVGSTPQAFEARAAGIQEVVFTHMHWWLSASRAHHTKGVHRAWYGSVTTRTMWSEHACW